MKKNQSEPHAPAYPDDDLFPARDGRTLDKFQRWLALLLDIRAGRFTSAAAMAEKYGVSERTICKDLRGMKAADVPVFYCRSERRYLFPGNLYAPPVHLSLDDCFTLTFLLGTLRGHPKIRALMEKLSHLRPDGALPGNGGPAAPAVAGPAVKVQASRIDPDTLKLIYRAIGLRQKLRFTYTPPGGTPYRIYVDPHGVCFVKHAWYMAAWYPPQSSFRYYRINRMEAPELLDKPFVPQAGFDLEKRLAEAWDIFEGNPATVRIRFAKAVAPYIRETRWHATQRLTDEPDGSLLFEADVADTREIRFWVLQYSADAEVLEPPHLRAQVLDEIRRMSERFLKGAPPEGEGAAGT